MSFILTENTFCMLENTQSQTNYTVQHAFKREFSKNAPVAMKILTGQKQVLKFFWGDHM